MITSWIFTRLFNIYGVPTYPFVELFPYGEEIGSMEDSPPEGGRGGESSGSMAESVKTKSSKVCGVCGDRAKSYHFGGISCDSCKAFFRRSVQNDAHRNFLCPYNGQCDISIVSRKCCQQCRFQKCLSIGMEKSWVMTEEERLQLVKQRMERKAKQDTTTTTTMTTMTSTMTTTSPSSLSPTTSDVGSQHYHHHHDRSHYLTDPECTIIQNILDKYNASLEQVPYSSDLRASNDDRSILDIVSMLTTTIKRMTHFAGSLETFAQLTKSDQASLLRCNMIEVCVIRAAFAYDPIRQCWPNTELPQYRDSPYLTVTDLRKLVSPELHQMHMKFNQSMRDMRLDETTYMLLLLVVLFSSDRPAASSSCASLENSRLVSTFQECYLSLLRQHMKWYFSEEVAAKLYPKLLLKLPDLRQVNDAHTQSQLQLTENDVASIQRQFGNILCGYRIEGASSSSSPAQPSPTTSSTSSNPIHSAHPVTPSTPPQSLSSFLSEDDLQQFRLFYPSDYDRLMLESQQKIEPGESQKPRSKRKKPP